MVKYEKFTLETNKKFDDVDAAFVEFEKQQEELNVNEISKVEETIKVEETNNTDSSLVVSINLKNIIEQELADSSRL